MAEPDESRIWKYLELPQVFQMKAGEIDIIHKQHLRTCEKLAKHLSKQKPKTPQEFERVEYLKDFVVKSAELNEKTISLLDHMKATIEEIYKDMEAWRDGARLNRVIRDQDEKLQQVMKERDEMTKKYYDLRREHSPAS